jgi:AraC-like DNA-binding protein
MSYSFQELLFSVSLAVYVAVCVVVGVVRWGHKCAPYDKHLDYYYPGWRTLALSALSNLSLFPAVFLPGETDAVLQIRMTLILSSPFLCSALIFSYFGRVLKVSWWRKPIYVLSGTYSMMSFIALVCTLLPGTQMQGSFLRGYFTLGVVLALVYLLGLVLALRMIIRPLSRFSEDSFSNPDDFPEQYAKSLIYIPFLHLVMSWSTTFNGNILAMSLGLFMLSVITVVILLGALSPHRAVEIERLEKEVSADKEESPLEMESLPQERKEEILRLIRHRVEEEQAYLDSHLTLGKLSQDCGCNRTYVSSVLNENLGGFFNYVNRCRLQHAEVYKQENPKADVDELAMACGFNSRQSYYNARKRL